MKDLAPGLQAHLDTRSTTMALCWKITRRDGLVQGFTEHDSDLTFGGEFALDFITDEYAFDAGQPVTYLASSGFTASRMQQSLGLAPDNLNVDGALSSDTINEDDLAAGLYDNAEVALFWVNWENTAERITMDAGNIGEVERRETAFSAEFRSMVHRLNQKGGRLYQRSCDAILGDARCKVDLTSGSFRGTGDLAAGSSGRNLVLTGIGAFASGFFTYGVLAFTTGANAGLRFEVKSHVGTAVKLWEIPPEAVAIGDDFTITAGCAKDAGMCKVKFSNLANFRGFPHIPGNDILSDYPREDDETLDGGSYFR